MSNCIKHIFLFACMLMLAPANAQFISRQRAIDVASVFMHEDSNTDILLASGNRNAKQMQEEGMNMEQMVVKLLQKVEELTLYIIQQEKRIKELENRITHSVDEK